ncbi:hypothetical protein BDW22DRAFT_1363353 [Trametopsis cervina]|nr:hypothetical protein BDW22DRAFT_1363353 [Trametopsis cervina]
MFFTRSRLSEHTEVDVASLFTLREPVEFETEHDACSRITAVVGGIYDIMAQTPVQSRHSSMHPSEQLSSSYPVIGAPCSTQISASISSATLCMWITLFYCPSISVARVYKRKNR